jgi:phenylacetate-CoA ligase
MIAGVYNLFGLAASTLLYPLAERAQKRSISPKLRILRREAALPFAERKVLARERLADILEHAGHSVPYYRDLFAAQGFDPAKVRKDSRYLEDLPCLTKDILREQGKRLISERYLDKIVREQKTGSSTGPAAIIYYDREALDWTAAQNILMLEWAGKRRYNREAHLSTRFGTPPSPEAARFEARKCFVLNRYNIYTDGFGHAAQERLIDDLLRAGAEVVQGHPSSMYALARYLKKQGRDGRGLFSLFVSTGEMITPAQRALIEEVFGARIADRYGACEFGVMAQEPAGGPVAEMLISDSLVWPECLPTGDGEDGTGELVFSGLRNSAMPLIRYRMGDLGTLEGRADGWWITKLTGRTHDAVEIDGELYPTHYLQDIFDRCGKIEDFQVAVKGGKATEFRLVVEPERWEETSAAVKVNFPTTPLRRIALENLVFVGIRGKFSYLLREGA